MQKPDKNASWDRAMKQISDQIKGYGEIQASRQKIMAEIAVNDMQAKNNLFYKMQEKQMLDPMQQEQLKGMKLANQGYEDQQQNAQGGNFDVSAPVYTMGDKGAEVVKPGYKDAVFNNILKAKQSLESQGKPIPAALQAAYERFTPEGQSFSEQKRKVIEGAAMRIRSGESNAKAEKKALLDQYPDMTWNTLDNLTTIEKNAKPDIIRRKKEDEQLKRTAIKELQREGYPPTEININAAMEQLRKQMRGN